MRCGVRRYAPDFSSLPIVRLHRLEVDLKAGTGAVTLVPELAHAFTDFPKVGSARPLWAPSLTHSLHLLYTGGGGLGPSLV